MQSSCKGPSVVGWDSRGCWARQDAHPQLQASLSYRHARQSPQAANSTIPSAAATQYESNRTVLAISRLIQGLIILIQ